MHIVTLWRLQYICYTLHTTLFCTVVQYSMSSMDFFSLSLLHSYLYLLLKSIFAYDKNTVQF